MAKLVYALDLGSSGEIYKGSSPFRRTTFWKHTQIGEEACLENK